MQSLHRIGTTELCKQLNCSPVTAWRHEKKAQEIRAARAADEESGKPQDINPEEVLFPESTYIFNKKTFRQDDVTAFINYISRKKPTHNNLQPKNKHKPHLKHKDVKEDAVVDMQDAANAYAAEHAG